LAASFPSRGSESRAQHVKRQLLIAARRDRLSTLAVEIVLDVRHFAERGDRKSISTQAIVPCRNGVRLNMATWRRYDHLAMFSSVQAVSSSPWFPARRLGAEYSAEDPPACRRGSPTRPVEFLGRAIVPADVLVAPARPGTGPADRRRCSARAWIHASAWPPSPNAWGPARGPWPPATK